jgi:hypothetical protein
MAMSRELMVVEQPDFLQKADIDAPAALRQVYRCYGFRLQDEIPEAGQTLIVAAQSGESEPQPISRDDYFAHSLDPVRGKAAGGKRVHLRKFHRLKNMLVFVFDPET